MTAKITKRWIFNAADEKAAANGYFMEEERGEHVCNFIESQLCLYEGDYAGRPIRLMDWQVEMFYRLFGWYLIVNFTIEPLDVFGLLAYGYQRKTVKAQPAPP